MEKDVSVAKVDLAAHTGSLRAIVESNPSGVSWRVLRKNKISFFSQIIHQNALQAQEEKAFLGEQIEI